MASKRVSYAREAMTHLRGADPVMARVIDAVGPIEIELRRERFQALSRAIIFQQLAGAAAHTIYTRFVALFPGRRFPTARQVLDASPEDLRRVGLSRQKSLYLKDLAAHVENGTLNFQRFAKMADEEIIVDLTRVHGVGRWTAEMFLMFNLGRPDVLPVTTWVFATRRGGFIGCARCPTRSGCARWPSDGVPIGRPPPGIYGAAAASCCPATSHRCARRDADVLADPSSLHAMCPV